MKKRKLGGIEVSEVGMGCMALSHGYGRIPERSESLRAIRGALSCGCTFFDTAEIYGEQLYHRGHNEEILGEALEGERKSVVIATKFHFGTADYAEGADLFLSVKRHLTESMKRLRTDYVDLYYLHRLNDNVPVEDAATVMGRLIGEGLIRGWGLSQVSGATLERADRATPVSAVQNLYNILERDCEEDIFPYCLAHGIGVVPFSPVASGLLSGKITTETEFEKVDDVRNWVPQLTRENIAGNRPIVDIVRKWADLKGATCAQVSIAWILAKFPNAVPIPGSKNPERVLENLGAADVAFTEEEFREFDGELSKCAVFGHRGHVEEKSSSGFLKSKPLR